MTSDTATERLAPKVWPPRQIYLACGLLTLAILFLDLLIPLGVAIGVCYVAVVLLSLWSAKKRCTVLVALLCSLLTIAVFFAQPVVPEMWKAIFNRVLSLLAIWVAATLGLQRKLSEQRREETLREREQALEDVRVLRGLLPICASCKKIRDDQGAWVQLEGYIRDHSEAEFSHGICQDCMKKLYPEYYRKTQETDAAS